MNIAALRKTLDSVLPALEAAGRARVDSNKYGISKSMETALRTAAGTNVATTNFYGAADRTNTAFGGIRAADILRGASHPVTARLNFGTGYRPYTESLNEIVNPARNSGVDRTIRTAKGTTGMFDSIVQPPALSAFSSLQKVEPRWTTATPSGLGVDPRSVSVMPTGWTEAFASKNVLNTPAFGSAALGWESPLFAKDHPIFQLARGFDTLANRLGDIVRAWQPAMDRISRQFGGMFDALANFDWEAFEKALLVQAARRPRTRVGFAALAAYHALYAGRPWEAEAFLVDYLRLQPNVYTREALWWLLRSAFENPTTEPKKWLTLEDENGIAYLRAAVWNEAKRIKRDQEMADRIWWAEGEREEDEDGVKLSKPALRADGTLDLWTPSSPGPEHLMIPPPPDDRPQVLERLSLNGTPRDQQIVRRVRSGEFEFKDLSNSVGSSQMLSFQRKARRWRKNNADTANDDG